MQLQGVCDNDMKFTDVYCIWPGAVHDARVLRNSPLFHDAEERTDDVLPGQTYIIASWPTASITSVQQIYYSAGWKYKKTRPGCQTSYTIQPSRQ